MKKLESISSPLSFTKTVDFENLLNYWSTGVGQPSSAYTVSTLYQLTEDLKLENCHYQKDVVDAMFSRLTQMKLFLMILFNPFQEEFLQQILIWE